MISEIEGARFATKTNDIGADVAIRDERIKIMCL